MSRVQKSACNREGNLKSSSLAIAVRRGLGAGSAVLLLSMSPLVYSQGTFGPVVELSDLDGSDGFVINGIDANDYSGVSVSGCLLYTSPSPRDATLSRMPSSA